MTGRADPVWPQPQNALPRPPAEAPGVGLALAAVGVIVLLLGYFLLDWDRDTSFLDIRSALEDTERSSNGVSDFTAVYVVLGGFILLTACALLSVLGAIGRLAVRIGSVVIGALVGLVMIAFVVLIEVAGVGNDDTRENYLPIFVAIVLGGLVIIALGVGALLDKSASVARATALLVAVIALIMHVYVVLDLFRGAADPSPGAWLPVLGFLALAVAPVLPYRRVRG